MTKQLLFYENATPITVERHRNWAIDGSTERYHFADKVNSVPLTAVEIPLAARDYSIVFAGADDKVVPVVILGVEGDDNLYVSEDGTWNAGYIPAFVRRYPFVFSLSDDGQTFTLCIDETWDGCNEEGRGERLFDDEGEKTPYLERVLEFLKDYQSHFKLTESYCAKLQELELLEPMQAQFTLASGDQRSLTGFMGVSRPKLKALDAEKLKELAATDELELTYTHLQSVNNFSNALNRAAQQRGASAKAAPPKKAAKKKS